MFKFLRGILEITMGLISFVGYKLLGLGLWIIALFFLLMTVFGTISSPVIGGICFILMLVFFFAGVYYFKKE